MWVTASILCSVLIIGGFFALSKNVEQVENKNPAEFLVPGNGSIEVKFEVLPTDGSPTQIRVYPLLDSGDPDGANEIVTNKSGVCYLNPGYYYLVVERDGAFQEVIRQIKKTSYVDTPTSVCKGATRDGIYRPSPVRFRTPELNRENGVVIGDFLVARVEYDIKNLNWEWAMHHAEAAGCLIATKQLLELAGDQIVDTEIKEWTLTSNGVHIEMKNQLGLNSWFFVFDKQTSEPKQRYYREKSLSFRLMRRLRPYSKN